MRSIGSFDDFISSLRPHLELAKPLDDSEFNRLALALFSLQFEAVPIYRELCDHRGVSPKTVKHWAEIPALPTVSFKEHDVSSLPANERTHVFHSSGTTQQIPSRHFHNSESLAVYEASLLPWFKCHFAESKSLLILTPPPDAAPHSSLVHMFETIRRDFGAPPSAFTGRIAPDGGWELDMEATVAALPNSSAVLGTAFSFVHLLDYCEAKQLRFRLPAGASVLETGGYKGRSRELPKARLHQMMTMFLGIPKKHIVTEYGMSELSSQAYERAGRFHFPPWCRAQIISPETGAEVAEGETGLLSIFDLANVRSVLAIQTEDLAIKRGHGFELLGRAAKAEPRGCSLAIL